ncbi:MAG: metallophosphoesterase family protein [Chloroflexota bacterium]|nr:metallophosphoesterase family protein [Chloroflexota bacterium]
MLIGLLADTHVPYRAHAIPPAVVAAFQGVDLILHAGDVDEPHALAPLEALAPVYAVRGNYHILDRSSGGNAFPKSLELELAGFHVAVHHGHKIGPAAWLWKARAMLRNLTGRWDFPAYDATIVRVLLHRFPTADIIVFGHTHRFYQARWGRALVINPGAAQRTAYFDAPFPPSVARLHLERGVPPQVARILLS